MVGSNDAICATRRGFSGRSLKPPSRTIMLRIFHCATSRSSARIRATISKGQHKMRKLLFESLFRRPFTEPAPSPDDAAVTELATAVGHAARRRLGRSLSIREVDAGSCNGGELEIHALNNAYYDVGRLGLRLVASAR